MIKQIIKSLIPDKILSIYYPYRWQIGNFKFLAKSYNQLESMKQWRCVDKDNKPLPWYSYPCIEYLSNLDFTKKQILEWGGDNHLFFGRSAHRG